MNATTTRLASSIVRSVEENRSGSFRSQPNWAVLGLTRAVLAATCENALDDADAEQLKAAFVARRIRSLIHGRNSMPDLSRIPRDAREGVVRMIAEERLALMRVTQEFLKGGPVMRPIVVQALRHAGMNVAGVGMLGFVNWSVTELPHPDGRLVVHMRATSRDGATPEEMIAGVPLGHGVRLTMGLDDRILISIPEIPLTTVAALAGKPLSDLVAHPALPGDAMIKSISRLSEIDATSAKGPEGDKLMVDFGLVQAPCAHGHLTPQELEPAPR